jgi:pimeloyl-ACP methyl ester carboxylesterase
MMLAMFLLILLILLVAIPLLAWVFGSVYKITRKPDRVHFTETADGWTLALSHYLPKPTKSRKKRLPVLLCHGLSGNHHCFDFSRRLSFARTLAEAGYDVFALDLRGSGYSEKPGLFNGRRYDWDFQDYLDKDVPAAIDHVLTVTGAKKLHWIGHSMGGMLAYGLLQGDMAAKVESAAAISSPGRLDQFKPLMKLRPVLEMIPTIHLGVFAKFGAPFSEMIPKLAHLIGNLSMERGHNAVSFANTVENLPGKLIRQFAGWSEQGHFILSDGRDLTAGREKITTPMLFLVGENDLTCIPESVHEVYESISSKKKKFAYLGLHHGQLVPYGHNSVLYGRMADRDVYPKLVDWLSSF